MKTRFSFCSAIALSALMLASCGKKAQLSPGSARTSAQSEYIVTAYVWPSCHDDTMARRALWHEGIGEWEIIKKGTPRFPGHYQPRRPLWGYEMDDDPKVIEKWINAALDNGVNCFAYDWYWFEGKPFLEGSLDDGFLKAANNQKMNFYLMYANHDVKRNFWNCYETPNDSSLLWTGAIDWPKWKALVHRVITKYFGLPNYLKIDGKPVFSIYEINNLLKTFGGSEDETLRGLNYLRSEAKKAGFPDVHIQTLLQERPSPRLLHLIKKLGYNSVTQYCFTEPTHEDYISWAEQYWDDLRYWDSKVDIPFIPNASICRDDVPRYPHKTAKDVSHYNIGPRTFGTYLQRAKEYCDAHPNDPKIITIDAWNEWVEGAYLMPDMKFGYEYLNTVKQVMVDGIYERYKVTK